MASTAVTAIETAIDNALSSPSSGSLIASILHTNSSLVGLNVKDKTMTTTWVAANQSTAILLEADGYTVILG